MGKLTGQPSRALYSRIVNAYEKLGSVKSVAKKCHASEVTVRRVLITEGLWSSRTSRKVKELVQQGKSVPEIADELSVSVKAVEAYLPYSRGMYGQEVTEDSVHAKEYRERVSDAQEGVRSLKSGERESEIRSDQNHEDLSVELEQGTSQIAEVSSEGKEDMQVPILRLHLELLRDPRYEEEDELGLYGQEKQTFLSLAKAQNGISRDILVPADMNLHALHYAIQRLFGWQNSHLHNFSLSEADFEQMTGDRIEKYTGLCGALFRFPTDDFSDIYWDDDYEENISVKSWLRKKYRRPYRCGGICDTWLGNCWNIEDYEESYREYTGEDALEGSIRERMFEAEPNCLVESLSVGELFLPPSVKRGSMRAWKEDIQDKIDALQEEMQAYGINEALARTAASELKSWRESLDQLKQVKWQNPATYRRDVRKQTGQSYDEALEQHEMMVNYWEEQCQELIFDWNIKLEPYFLEIYYNYDYGDNWWVKTTAVEEMQEPPADVDWDGNVVCVAADGLNLVDDCGGIGGYLDMLETIHGDDKEEAQDMRNWARMMGWTGRKSRQEKML